MNHGTSYKHSYGYFSLAGPAPPAQGLIAPSGGRIQASRGRGDMRNYTALAAEQFHDAMAALPALIPVTQVTVGVPGLSLVPLLQFPDRPDILPTDLAGGATAS